ncbi:MAG: hypothetical protein HN810_06280 [Acidiferrobacteraceae bacterium]|jgi:hypothetical protein|nr:hypothetical protein [Acidiferrobacteraceae bacterium]MBT5622960.1 hypothetical protein [Acidiferrobacteraceae bacterium]MBT7353706.1 hypothetical protein [Acidiferrobacteraceae bacterium]
MSKKYLIIGSFYLVALFSFLSGMYVIMARVWPYEHVMTVRSFLIGEREEKKTVKEKIENDLGLKPSRLLETYNISDADRSNYRAIKIPDANKRRDAGLVYMSDNIERGLRLIYGALDTEGAMHGAILLDDSGNVIHQWKVTEDNQANTKRKDTNKYLHGLEVFPDGSMIFSFDGGGGLYRIDACGSRLWKIKGNFHHSVSNDGASAVWAWRNHDMVKVDINTAEILRTINITALDKANSELGLFGIRQQDGESESNWAHDPHHPNDLEPLLPENAAGYPQFNVGDLLISFRSLNLVFVIDPVNLQVKWWRIGQWRRQHDPDWNRDGKLYVYDNNMHHGSSHIVQIDPITMKSHRVVEGSDFNFYSSHMGKLDITPNGSVLVTSPKQGRVFEVSSGGQKTFEFINQYNQSTDEVLVVTGAKFLPEDYFDENSFLRCR